MVKFENVYVIVMKHANHTLLNDSIFLTINEAKKLLLDNYIIITLNDYILNKTNYEYNHGKSVGYFNNSAFL